MVDARPPIHALHSKGPRQVPARRGPDIDPHLGVFSMHGQLTLERHQPTSPCPGPDPEGAIWADACLYGDSDQVWHPDDLAAFLASKQEAAR
jgi:hypothetical protein